MRSGAEIEEAMKALAAFKQAYPDCSPTLLLQLSGEGSIRVYNRKGFLADEVGFTEVAALSEVVARLYERFGETA